MLIANEGNIKFIYYRKTNEFYIYNELVYYNSSISNFKSKSKAELSSSVLNSVFKSNISKSISSGSLLTFLTFSSFAEIFFLSIFNL